MKPPHDPLAESGSPPRFPRRSVPENLADPRNFESAGSERSQTGGVAGYYAELDRSKGTARSGRSKTWFARSLVLLIGLICGACLSARLPGELLVSAARLPGPAPGHVAVRLAEAEGRFDLNLEGQIASSAEIGSPAVVKLIREGSDVVAILADGSEQREAWFRIEPTHSGGEVRFEDRRFRGPILVEPRSSGGLRATHYAELEDYVRDVVAAELPLWNANSAELGAQAIAARTYARATLGTRGLDSSSPFLWDDQRDQVFRGRFQPTPSERNRGLERLLDRAVDETRGQVLAQSGQVATASFHASCGGRTSLRSEVFGGTDGASALTRCDPCAGLPAGHQVPSPNWNWTASSAQLSALAEAFGLGDRLESLRPASIDHGGRWLTVELRGNGGTTTRRFQEFRRVLGFQQLPSGVITRTWPALGAKIESGFYFEGRGRGHGVGLCQHGAHGYGERGWSSREILEHYYRGAEIAVR